MIFLDLDDTILTPPYEAVARVAKLLGDRDFPSRKMFETRKHIEYYDAFPKHIRSKRHMWSLAFLSIPFGLFRSYRLYPELDPAIKDILQNKQILFLTKNPSLFKRPRTRQLKKILGYDIRDRYIAVGSYKQKSKSKAKAILEYSKRYGIPVEQCTMIDDCPQNLEDAIQIGIQNCYLIDASWNRDFLSSPQVKRITRQSLPQILVKILAGKTNKEATLPLPTIGVKLNPSWKEMFKALIRPRPQNELTYFLLASVWKRILFKRFLKKNHLAAQEVLRQHPKLQVHFLQNIGKPFTYVSAADQNDSIDSLFNFKNLIHTHLNQPYQRRFWLSEFFYQDYDHANILREVQLSAAVETGIQSYRQNHPIPQDKAEKMALHYAKKMINKRMLFVCKWSSYFVGLIFNRLFRNLEIYNIDKVVGLEKGAFVIYAPIHRSYLDSAILYVILARYGHQYPIVAAAMKMQQHWMGKIGRYIGAFFIARKKMDSIYTGVLRAFLLAMHRRKLPLEIFIEGKRSRSGLTLPPKKGILSTAIGNLEETDIPIKIVPVSFVYNKLPESELLLNEVMEERKKGGLVSLREQSDWLVNQKQKQRLFFKFSHMFSGALSLIKKGTVDCYVNFGDPILIECKSIPQDKESQDLFIQKHLDNIMFSVNSITPILPSSVASLFIHSHPEKHIDKRVLERILPLSNDLLAAQGIPDYLYCKDLGKAFQEINEFVFINRKFKENKILEPPIYSIQDLDITRSSHYSHNILHYFIIPSIIAKFIMEANSAHLHDMIRYFDFGLKNIANRYFISLHGLGQIEKIFTVFIEHKLILKKGENFIIQDQPEYLETLQALAHISSMMGQYDLQHEFTQFRRILDRVNVSVNVMISSLSKNIVQAAKMTNISSTGAFLTCKEPKRYELDETIDLVLKTTELESISKARVMRITDTGIGVQVSQLPVDYLKEQATAVKKVA